MLTSVVSASTRLPSALKSILCGSQVRFLEGRQMETTGCGDGLVNCRPACALGGGVVVAWCEYGSKTRFFPGDI